MKTMQGSLCRLAPAPLQAKAHAKAIWMGRDGTESHIYHISLIIILDSHGDICCKISSYVGIGFPDDGAFGYLQDPILTSWQQSMHSCICTICLYIQDLDLEMLQEMLLYSEIIRSIVI